MRRRTHVPISELASFAVDPEGYRARKGGPISAPAAAYGRSYHDDFSRSGRSVPSWRWAVLGFLALLVLALVYLVVL